MSGVEPGLCAFPVVGVVVTALLSSLPLTSTSGGGGHRGFYLGTCSKNPCPRWGTNPLPAKAWTPTKFPPLPVPAPPPALSHTTSCLHTHKIFLRKENVLKIVQFYTKEGICLAQLHTFPHLHNVFFHLAKHEFLRRRKSTPTSTAWLFVNSA